MIWEEKLTFGRPQEEEDFSLGGGGSCGGACLYIYKRRSVETSKETIQFVTYKINVGSRLKYEDT